MHVNGERSTLTNIDDLYLTIIILKFYCIRKSERHYLHIVYIHSIDQKVSNHEYFELSICFLN